jgi:hypothetical protein
MTGPVRAIAPNPHKLRLGKKVPHRESDPRTKSPIRFSPSRGNGVSTLTARAQLRAFRPTGALPVRPTRCCGMPSRLFIRWARVTCNIRIGSTHCRSSDASVGRGWRRRLSSLAICSARPARTRCKMQKNGEPIPCARTTSGSASAPKYVEVGARA